MPRKLPRECQLLGTFSLVTRQSAKQRKNSRTVQRGPCRLTFGIYCDWVLIARAEKLADDTLRSAPRCGQCMPIKPVLPLSSRYKISSSPMILTDIVGQLLENTRDCQ